MLRVLQSIEGKNLDSTKKAKVDIKRGAFIKSSEKDGNISLAATLADVNGLATRDFVVTQESAMGMAVSDYDETQDVIKAGEFAGVMIILAGERYATTEYDETLVDLDVEADKYLTVVNGKLAKSVEATSIVSLGWIMDAGLHKLLGFKILK